MPSTNAPFGLRAVRHNGGGTIRSKKGKIATGANAMYKNSPIRLTATGTIEDAAATETLLGAFIGCTYTSNGKFFFSNYWPNAQAADDAICYYYDDPEIIYAIQADGAVAEADIGSHGDLTAAGNGSTSTGISAATITATPVTSGTAQLQVVGLFDVPDNAWGDAFTTVEVRIAEHQWHGSAGDAY